MGGLVHPRNGLHALANKKIPATPENQTSIFRGLAKHLIDRAIKGKIGKVVPVLN
jgi:hypothetical protein